MLMYLHQKRLSPRLIIVGVLLQDTSRECSRSSRGDAWDLSPTFLRSETTDSSFLVLRICHPMGFQVWTSETPSKEQSGKTAMADGRGHLTHLVDESISISQ